MNTKTTALIALLIPAVAMLAACNRPADPAVDATPSAAMSEPAPVDTMPADTMPAATMPADGAGMMGDDNMAFADMDKNKDGGVTHDELATGTMLDQHFSTADSDGDGKLSDAEIMKHRADMAAAPAM